MKVFFSPVNGFDGELEISDYSITDNGCLIMDNVMPPANRSGERSKRVIFAAGQWRNLVIAYEEE